MTYTIEYDMDDPEGILAQCEVKTLEDLTAFFYADFESGDFPFHASDFTIQIIEEASPV